MTCNVQSALFAITPTVADVAGGGALPLSTVARRLTIPCNAQRIELGSDSINIGTSGYYQLDATITFTATDAGPVTITAYQNGAPIAGITATETITTATTEVRTISLTGLVRARCEPLAITLVNESEGSITVSNIALRIVRVA